MWLCLSAKFVEDPSVKNGVQLKSNESSIDATEKGGFAIGWVGQSYLFGLLLVEIWGQFLHPYLLGEKLPFVPLLLISIYCALGIMYSWIWQLSCIVKST